MNPEQFFIPKQVNEFRRSLVELSPDISVLPLSQQKNHFRSTGDHQKPTSQLDESSTVPEFYGNDSLEKDVFILMMDRLSRPLTKEWLDDLVCSFLKKQSLFSSEENFIFYCMVKKLSEDCNWEINSGISKAISTSENQTNPYPSIHESFEVLGFYLATRDKDYLRKILELSGFSRNNKLLTHSFPPDARLAMEAFQFGCNHFPSIRDFAIAESKKLHMNDWETLFLNSAIQNIPFNHPVLDTPPKSNNCLIL